MILRRHYDILPVKGGDSMASYISKETLDILSYKSTLGRSLKQISLRNTPLELILEDIARYRASYIDVLV